MVEVNEALAKAYFELIHGAIVRTDYYYKKFGQKGGAGPSDIDLVIHFPKPGKYGKYAIVSVKGWHNHIFNLKQFSRLNKWDLLFGNQELNAARKFLGVKVFTKILVLPKIKDSDRALFIKRAKKQYGLDVLDFTIILNELIERLDTHRSYDEESLQTVRLIKKYFLKRK